MERFGTIWRDACRMWFMGLSDISHPPITHITELYSICLPLLHLRRHDGGVLWLSWQCGCDSSHFPPTSRSEYMTLCSRWSAAVAHSSVLFIEKPATETLQLHYCVLATTASKISDWGSSHIDGCDQMNREKKNKDI